MQIKTSKNPPADLVLFNRIGPLCNGFPPDAVFSACFNLIANVITQQCQTSQQAEQVFDQVAANMKTMMMQTRYYPGGLRKTLVQAKAAPV